LFQYILIKTSALREVSLYILLIYLY